MFKQLLRARALRKAFACIEADDAPGLNKLLDAGLDPNAHRCYPRTGFHQGLLLAAVDAPAPACTQALLAAGADPNAFNQVGLTPFRSALNSMKAALWKSWEDFTPDTPYESHPAFSLVAQMFVRGGNRHYRPAGYVEPSGFAVRGPSPAAQAFEATIDAWLEVQGARLRSHGYDRGMPAPAPTAKSSHRL